MKTNVKYFSNVIEILRDLFKLEIRLKKSSLFETDYSNSEKVEFIKTVMRICILPVNR